MRIAAIALALLVSGVLCSCHAEQRPSEVPEQVEEQETVQVSDAETEERKNTTPTPEKEIVSVPIVVEDHRPQPEEQNESQQSGFPAEKVVWNLQNQEKSQTYVIEKEDATFYIDRSVNFGGNILKETKNEISVLYHSDELIDNLREYDGFLYFTETVREKPEKKLCKISTNGGSLQTNSVPMMMFEMMGSCIYACTDTGLYVYNGATLQKEAVIWEDTDEIWLSRFTVCNDGVVAEFKKKKGKQRVLCHLSHTGERMILKEMEDYVGFMDLAADQNDLVYLEIISTGEQQQYQINLIDLATGEELQSRRIDENFDNLMFLQVVREQQNLFIYMAENTRIRIYRWDLRTDEIAPVMVYKHNVNALDLMTVRPFVTKDYLYFSGKYIRNGDTILTRVSRKETAEEPQEEILYDGVWMTQELLQSKKAQP